MVEENDLTKEVVDSSKALQEADKALGRPMSLLLGPSFKLIGEHWGKKTENWLNRQQVENVKKKIDSAAKDGNLDLGNESTPRQIGALIEWTHLASDVDEDEQPLLSIAWTSALVDISKNQYGLLDTLSRLDEETIELVVSGGEISRESERKLVDCGIIRTRNKIVPSQRMNETLDSVYALIFCALLFAGIIFLASHGDDESQVYFQLAGGVFLASVLIAVSIVRLQIRWDVYARKFRFFRKLSTVNVQLELTPFGLNLRRRLTNTGVPIFRSTSP